MKIGTLKSNAKNRIQPFKKTLYESAAVYILAEFVLMSIFGTLEQFGYKISNFETVFSLLICPILFANITMVSQIYKNEQISSNSFSFYNEGFWRSLLSYLVPNLLLFLWGLLLGFVIGLTGILITYNRLFLILLILFFVAGIIFIVYKALQYSLVPYIMSFDQEIHVAEALKESKSLLRGHNWQLFILNLSFIGWGILLPFTLGFLFIWLFPYYNATIIEFYLGLKDKNLASKSEPVFTV